LPWLIGLFYWIGMPGYPPQVYVEMVAIMLALWIARARWEAVSVLFANLGVGTIGTGVKMLVARARPSPDLISVANPALDGGKLSFPAGHVLVYLTVFGFLMYLLLRVPQRVLWQNIVLVILGLMIALIGVSRIYSGEHWFSDVVGGYLFGIMGLWLTIRFYEWGSHRFFTGKSTHAQTETTQPTS
jgi:membrane-associated phospholipid phosphatase